MKKENAHNESELSDDFNAWVDYVFSHPFLHYAEQNCARIDLFETILLKLSLLVMNERIFPFC
jgi:HSP20 family protein